jgi:hypothetical protein
MFGIQAVPARAQTTAVGPYYATPSWDQTLPCATPATCPRFIVLSNFNSEAVLDRETGLVWERSPTGSDGWADVLFTCHNKALGNRKGWRLPTIEELTSLIDPSVAFPGPTLPAGHPFIGVESPTTFYWSATTWAADASYALYVRFSDGVVDASIKANSRVGWCVRGGQGTDPQ